MSAHERSNRGSRKRYAPGLILVVVLALVLGRQIVSSRLGMVGKSNTSELQTPEPTEDLGPLLDFSVQDISGQPVQLSDLRGEVVLVNFWATWCPPCREEMPLLQDYYLAHREEGFVLLGVNVSDRPEAAAEFIDENGYEFTVWFDPPGNVLIDLGMNGLPVSLLVDTDGHLHKRWIGPLTSEVLEAEVTPLFSSSAN